MGFAVFFATTFAVLELFTLLLLVEYQLLNIKILLFLWSCALFNFVDYYLLAFLDIEMADDAWVFYGYLW